MKQGHETTTITSWVSDKVGDEDSSWIKLAKNLPINEYTWDIQFHLVNIQCNVVTSIKLQYDQSWYPRNEKDCNWLSLHITIYYPCLVPHICVNKTRLVHYEWLPLRP